MLNVAKNRYLTYKIINTIRKRYIMLPYFDCNKLKILDIFSKFNSY